MARSYDSSSRLARAKASRQAVLDAARELFAAHGIAGVTNA